MFNFFKKVTFPQSDLQRWAKSGLISKNVETDAMDVVEKAYPKIVQEIHHEFMTAGDKLLQTATDLLNVLSIPNQEKVEKLNEFGFTKTKQVTETLEIKNQIVTQKNISETVSHFRIQYTNYKFITQEIAEKICKKYSLVLGSVSDYKGFVPERNLSDIDKFFDQYPKDKNTYYKKHAHFSSFSSESIDEKEYEEAMAFKKEELDNELSLISMYHYYKSQSKLFIFAPIKDMDMTHRKLDGVRVVENYPDPIVLLPKQYNGVKGFLILTAWGDEASDPLVVNHQNN